MANILCSTSSKFFQFSKQCKLLKDSNLGNIVQNVMPMIGCTNSGVAVVGYQLRNSSFRASKPVGDIEDYPQVEIITNPPGWKFVKRLVGNSTVPQPQPKKEYPSGWQPQNKDVLKREYFVARTKNHMIPVYLKLTYRGARRITKLRRIEGDIWKLEGDLKEMIEKEIGRKIITRVNEMSGQIDFKGEYVNLIQNYLMQKGF